MKYAYKTKDTCSTLIEFELNGDKVSNIVYTGGCNGNLKALCKLLDGSTVWRIKEALGGITCGRRPTSCGDQLAKAVEKAYNESVRR